MSHEAKDLTPQVRTFATNLSAVLTGVLPGIEGPPLRVLTDRQERHISVRQGLDVGLPLTIDGQTMMRLKISYRCTWNTEREFLSVDECQYQVLPESLTEPLLRYHYRRKPSGGLPSAHLHVHGHRDEVLALMVGGKEDRRVKKRLQEIRHGRFPRLSSLHFPLGGPRFRPGIEDVLDMLRVEFEIDVLPGANEALRRGRTVYRQMQLAAAIGDDPLTAAAELARLGYSVSPALGDEPRLRNPEF